MKRIIRGVLLLQLVVFTWLGAFFYFQNAFVKLFYHNISYVDIMVQDQDAFDAFLSWTEKRGIVVTQVNITPDNDVTMYMSNWALSEKLKLVEGNIPIKGEFVSDIQTTNTKQSGVMKKLLPNYQFAIYGLYTPKQFGFFSRYMLSTTSLDEITEMQERLSGEGVIISLGDIFDDNVSVLSTLNVSRVQAILFLIFVCVSTMVEIVALQHFFMQQLNTVSTSDIRIGGRLRFACSVICKLFFNLSWVSIAGTFGVILGIGVFVIERYRSFVLQIIVFYVALFILISLLYSVLIGWEMLTYFLVHNRTIIELKHKKPGPLIQLTNYCFKFVVSVMLFVSFICLVGLQGQNKMEQRNLHRWDNLTDLYRISMCDVGQDYDIKIEVELHKKVEQLYRQLTKENGAFVMDANDVFAMEVLGLDYPLTGLVTEGNSTHITVSPNYFMENPIYTSDGQSVDQAIIYQENVINILVPETLGNIYEEIKMRFQKYFEFYRFKVYDNVYSDAPNDSWNPSREEELKVNIIPVKAGQYYFTFSTNIRRNSENKILDPVVVVYTDNLHPSTIFTMTSRALFFRYDRKQEMSPNEYLAQYVGMDDFVYADCAWRNANEKAVQYRNNFYASVMLTLFIIVCYITISYCIWKNCYIRKDYPITVFIPTLLASGLFIILQRMELAYILPVYSLWEIIIMGIVMFGIDVFILKSLRDKGVRV